MANLVKRPGVGPGKRAPMKKVVPAAEEKIVEKVQEPVVEPQVVIDDAVEETEEVKTVEEVENVEEILIESVAPNSKEELQERLEKIEEATVQEAVVEAVVEEVKEEKPKKKSAKKKATKKKEEVKKEEVVAEEVVEPKEEENLEPYKAKPLSESMEFMLKITECTTPEWENRKAIITEQVESMHIDPDATPGEMRYLIADIDAALSQLKIYKSNADQDFTPLLKHIQYIANKAGTVGKNSEERKVNAIEGLIRYKANPDDTEYTNLLEIQTFAENQIKFYDEMINILQDKKAMLITFSSVVKTEAQLGGY